MKGRKFVAATAIAIMSGTVMAPAAHSAVEEKPQSNEEYLREHCGDLKGGRLLVLTHNRNGCLLKDKETDRVFLASEEKEGNKGKEGKLPPLQSKKNPISKLRDDMNIVTSAGWRAGEKGESQNPKDMSHQTNKRVTDPNHVPNPTPPAPTGGQDIYDEYEGKIIGTLYDTPVGTYKKGEEVLTLPMPWLAWLEYGDNSVTPTEMVDRLGGKNIGEGVIDPEGGLFFYPSSSTTLLGERWAASIYNYMDVYRPKDGDNGIKWSQVRKYLDMFTEGLNVDSGNEARGDKMKMGYLGVLNNLRTHNKGYMLPSLYLTADDQDGIMIKVRGAEKFNSSEKTYDVSGDGVFVDGRHLAMKYQ